MAPHERSRGSRHRKNHHRIQFVEFLIRRTKKFGESYVCRDCIVNKYEYVYDQCIIKAIKPVQSKNHH